MKIKNKFPFRIGTSSYIIPDNIIPNIEYLADKVDDIEILLFESDEISNLPDSGTIEKMKELAEKHSITYNIHLPVDIVLGATDENLRKTSVEKVLKVINLMKPVNPLAYILHLTGNPDIMGKNNGESIADWLTPFDNSLKELTTVLGSYSSLIAVETLHYPFSAIDELINKYNLSVCLDVGHLLLYNHSVTEYFKKYIERTKVVHLHGIKNGKDHNHIGYLNKDVLKFVVKSLTVSRNNQRILTLEIFNESDFNNSVKILKKYI